MFDWASPHMVELLVGTSAAAVAVAGAALAGWRAAHTPAPIVPLDPTAPLQVRQGVGVAALVLVPALLVGVNTARRLQVSSDSLTQLRGATQSPLEFLTSDSGNPQLLFGAVRTLLGWDGVTAPYMASLGALVVFVIALGVALRGRLTRLDATAAALVLSVFSYPLREFPTARAAPFDLALLAVALRAAWGPRTWTRVRPELVAVACISLASLDMPVVAGWLLLLWATERDTAVSAAYAAAAPPLLVGVVAITLRAALYHSTDSAASGLVSSVLENVVSRPYVWLIAAGASAVALRRERWLTVVLLVGATLLGVALEPRKLLVYFVPLFALAGVGSVDARGARWRRPALVVAASVSLAIAVGKHVQEQSERAERIHRLTELRAAVPPGQTLTLWPSWSAAAALVETREVALDGFSWDNPFPAGLATSLTACDRGRGETWHALLPPHDRESFPEWDAVCGVCEVVRSVGNAKLVRCPPVR